MECNYLNLFIQFSDSYCWNGGLLLKSSCFIGSLLISWKFVSSMKSLLILNHENIFMVLHSKKLRVTQDFEENYKSPLIVTYLGGVPSTSAHFNFRLLLLPGSYCWSLFTCASIFSGRFDEGTYLRQSWKLNSTIFLWKKIFNIHLWSTRLFFLFVLIYRFILICCAFSATIIFSEL